MDSDKAFENLLKRRDFVEKIPFDASFMPLIAGSLSLLVSFTITRRRLKKQRVKK